MRYAVACSWLLHVRTAVFLRLSSLSTGDPRETYLEVSQPVNTATDNVVDQVTTANDTDFRFVLPMREEALNVHIAGLELPTGTKPEQPLAALLLA